MNKIVVIACLASLFYLVGWQRTVQAEQFEPVETPSRFIEHIVDPSQSRLAFYWRDKNKQPYGSFQNLKAALATDNKTLLFAMNGGIFQKDLTPLGLYIEGGVVKYRLSTRQHAFGNFYIQPNGVFYMTESGQGFIVPTTHFKHDASIQYATQSGPLLLVDGDINPKLISGSTNLRIRNGVGILPDGRLLFAISKGFVNFYDFADYFKQRGCQNALYLDGSISRIYLPHKNILQDGQFGVMIAEIKRLIVTK
jgi:uncharacterized protein YigE (DUF2233 family)